MFDCGCVGVRMYHTQYTCVASLCQCVCVCARVCVYYKNVIFILNCTAPEFEWQTENISSKNVFKLTTARILCEYSANAACRLPSLGGWVGKKKQAAAGEEKNNRKKV